MKMLEISVSGSFKTQVASDKERQNFDNIKITMPFCDEDYYIQFSQRLFPIYLRKDKRYNEKNYEGLIKIYIDAVEEMGGKPLCVGKDIKLMTWEELQSLSCYKKIREIPLYKIGDLRHARERAYIRYEEQVNGRRVFRTEQEIIKFKDSVTQELLRLQMNEREIELDISKRLSKALSLVVDPNNPMNSYSFMKLPPIVVADPEPKQERPAPSGDGQSSTPQTQSPSGSNKK